MNEILWKVTKCNEGGTNTKNSNNKSGGDLNRTPPLSLTSLVHIGLTQDFHVTQNQNNATVIYNFMWIFSCKNVLTFTWLSFISSNTYFYFLKLALKNIGEMNGYSYQMPNKLLKSSINFINKYQNTLVFILKLQCL